MKVQFVNDFRGRETQEVFYQAGEVGEVTDEYVVGLLREGVVVTVDMKEETLDSTPPTNKKEKQK